MSHASAAAYAAISISFLVAAASMSACGRAQALENAGAAPRASEASLPAPSDDLLASLEDTYEDIHAHPELAMQEERTAGIAADWLRRHGYEVTEGVGGTGVVGVLRNGEGATVLMRADMDALPMEEDTGLPYASDAVATDETGQRTPVAHTCGHDMHVVWLMGAARILAESRDAWRGTVLAVFQPAEETGEGARAMVEDGMVERFPEPDVALAQHVLPLPAGRIGLRPGTMLSMADSWEVTLFGRGGHGSSPESTIDPVVMAAAAVMRLQTVVSREIAATAGAVVTVGALRAGSSANVIPSEAVLRLNVRTFDEQVREKVLSSIERIIEAEAKASGAPKEPGFSRLSRFPLTSNDEAATSKVVDAFERRLGREQVQEYGPASASEDFSVFARAWNVPSVYWAVGGTDRETYARAEQAGRLNELPSNHSPGYAPVVHPTLRVGVEAMLAAAGAWLVDEAASR